MSVTSDIAFKYEKEWTLVPKIINKKFKYLIGGVPHWVDFKIDLNGKLYAGINGGSVIKYGFENTNHVSVGARYENGSWSPVNKIDKDYRLLLSNTGFVNSGVRLDIYPVVDIKLSSIIGPDFSLDPYLKYDANYSLSENWNKTIDLGVDAVLGVSAEVLGKEILSLSRDLNLININFWSVPAKLVKENGDNQSGQIGRCLPAPIKLKVTNSSDQPVENVQVYFLPSPGGEVSHLVIKTDANGNVQQIGVCPGLSGNKPLKHILKTVRIRKFRVA